MDITLRLMAIEDYQDVFSLWSSTDGIDLTEDDQEDRISLYLRRNPATCFVATHYDKIVGCVLCGHDGRRAILRHLAVKNEFRGRGIAQNLVKKCFLGLRQEGIQKCNIFVLHSNLSGAEFWSHMKWYQLDDNYDTLQYIV